jgi:hypothetical protein
MDAGGGDCVDDVWMVSAKKPESLADGFDEDDTQGRG